MVKKEKKKKKPIVVSVPLPKKPVIENREEFVRIEAELIGIEKELAHERW